MLLKAFRSPAVLGMEFWNEDSRYHTKVCSYDFCRPSEGNGIFLGEEYGYERHEKLRARTGNPFIDLLLAVLSLPGINYDALPKEFHQIALALEELRRGFISGGKNGGLFELNPFDVRAGLWQEDLYEVEHHLQQGSYDWDRMNLRGLDFEHNTDLAWLKPGEPRRIWIVRQGLFNTTTVRVLKDGTAVVPCVYGALMHGSQCERFEIIERFSFSTCPAKFPGCIPENLFSPKSPT